MNQEKIGKFIAECRKANELTQAGLAEKLGITDRAVSKWETGKSVPDASIMLELCEILKINVNELLTGEHITMDNYKEIAEKNLLEMKKHEEEANKRLLKLEVVLGLLTVIPALVMVGISSYLFEKGEKIIPIILVAIGITVMIVGCCFGLKIEHDAGYYECPNCGERYVPTMKAVVMAPHIGRTRKMKCPCCGQKGYHKKVLTKE